MYQLTPNLSVVLPFNTPFQITLEEPTNTNHQWEIVLPSGVRLTKSHYSVAQDKISTLVRLWDLVADAPGTYNITCHYRKLCCSRAISQSLTYTITLLP